MSTIAERRRAQAVAISVLEEVSDPSRPSPVSRALQARAESALRHLTAPAQLHDHLSELLSMIASLLACAAFGSTMQHVGSVEAAKASPGFPRNHLRDGFYLAIARGSLVPTTVFRSSSGRSSSALSRAVRAGRLFFVELDGIRAFPSFFVDPRYPLRDLEAVTKQLAGISFGAKWLFFVLPKASLSSAKAVAPSGYSGDATAVHSAGCAAEADGVSLRTPLQAIEDGDVELVLRIAAAYAAS